ncbi:HlyD family secretion protein [Dethiosulfatibacter aminovorans DSM 17477]|uniref:HlyD family secretion protein n=1 Tax=Dethiosulfatibacter aminovorans DSM 17477 TaxID=1121476 RepID=A0A1M6KHP9_9FIRM|nr:efflux RND transporter periplasmic adaptor subunit [Dethiosulfatibacter aminovorans]SHJ58430.1 HlyD family secretion protein [Dethiosulfatibacter aminovorans DSM 17477]
MKKKSRERTIAIIVILAIAVAGFVGYGKYTESKEAADAVSNIREVAYTVVKDDIKKSITGSGSLEPSDVRTVSSEVEGTIATIFVEEGQMVSEDEILAIYDIDSDDEDQQYDIDMAEYNLTVAKNDLSDLYDTYGEMQIYADREGTISYLVETGDSVSRNGTLARLNEVNVIKAQSYFTAAQIENIHVGDKASVFLSDYLITLEGKVTSTDSTPVATGSGAVGYEVEVEIEYSGVLSEGSPVRITVENYSGTYVSPYEGASIENDVDEITSPYDGEVDKIYFESGDYVEKGDLLAVISSDDILEEIAKQELTVEAKRLALEELNEDDTTAESPITGTVLTVYVNEDGYVEKGDSLFMVADLDVMEIIIDVDELDILSIEKGQNVTIECDVFEDETFSGTVDSISLSGSSSGGVTTYEVTILVDDRKDMMAGMNVDAEIIIKENTDTLIVPVEAIEKAGNKYVVQMKDEEGNLTPQVVEVGIANESYVEIVSGLSEGDLVYYYEISSSDSESTNIMMPGMGQMMDGGERPERPGNGGGER